MGESIAEVAAIATKLTKGQAWALVDLSPDEWQPGPYIADAAVPHLAFLRENGLIEREFGNLGATETSADEGGLSVRCSACWWFRLTERGIALRNHLISQGADHDR